MHLLLRVVDVLLNNLLEDVLQWDKKDDLNKKRGEKKGVHRERLQAAVRSCGVSFDIWEKTNADGKGSGTYDFTSLLGNDKKQLLREFPGKILSVVQTSTSNTVKKIWEDFRELYTFIGSGQNSDKQITVFFEKAKSWVNLFISLRDKRKGYERARITPYIHAMVFHIPKFFRTHKSVKIFTGQGVEKNNDYARNIVLYKSNKWDAASDVLKVEARQWALRKSEREKRPYNKSNTEYWEKDLLEARSKKRKTTFDPEEPE